MLVQPLHGITAEDMLEICSLIAGMLQPDESGMHAHIGCALMALRRVLEVQPASFSSALAQRVGHVVSRVADLLDLPSEITQILALRCIQIMCDASAHAAERVARSEVFRLSLLNLLSSHHEEFVQTTLETLLAVLKHDDQSFAGDAELRLRLINLLHGFEGKVTRLAAMALGKVSAVDAVVSAQQPEVLDAMGMLMQTGRFEMQQSALTTAFELSKHDSNLVALGRNTKLLEGVCAMLRGNDMQFVVMAANTISNMCRHADNHEIVATHPTCMFDVVALLASTDADVVVPACNILWNVSSRPELRHDLCSCHPQLFSLLSSVVQGWTSTPAVLVGALSILHHLSSVAPGREGIAGEIVLLDTLMDLTQDVNYDVQEAASGALQNMTFADSLRPLLCSNKRFVDVLATLLRHDNETLRRMAASALWNLSAHASNRVALATNDRLMVPCVRMLQGQSVDTIEHVVNALWHITTNPTTRQTVCDVPLMLDALVGLARLQVTPAIKKGLLHVFSHLSADEQLRIVLPEQRGLLTFLIRTLSEGEPEMQRPASSCLFNLSLSPQSRELIAMQPLCVPTLLEGLRSPDATVVEFASGTLHNLVLQPAPRHLVMKDPQAVETLVAGWDSSRLNAIKYTAAAVANVAQSAEYRIRIGGLPHFFTKCKALVAHGNEEVVRSGAAILSRLAHDGPNRAAMLHCPGLVDAVVMAIASGNPSTVHYACVCLWCLTLEDAGKVVVCKCGGSLKQLTGVLSATDDATVEAATSALWNMAVDRGNHLVLAQQPMLLERLADVMVNRPRKIAKAAVCCVSHVSATTEARQLIVSIPPLLAGVVQAIAASLTVDPRSAGPGARYLPSDDRDIQLPGVIIMRNLCALTSMSHAVVSAQNAVPVLEALLMSKDAQVALAAVTTVRHALEHPENKRLLGDDVGIVNGLIETVQSPNAGIAATAAACFSLVTTEPTLHYGLSIVPGFVDCILGLLRTADVGLILHGVNALWNLSVCERNRDVNYVDVLQAALSAMCNMAAPINNRHTIASRRPLLEAIVRFLEHPQRSVRDAARRTLALLFETTAASSEPVLPYLDSLVEQLRASRASVDGR